MDHNLTEIARLTGTNVNHTLFYTYEGELPIWEKVQRKGDGKAVVEVPNRDDELLTHPSDYVYLLDSEGNMVEYEGIRHAILFQEQDGKAAKIGIEMRYRAFPMAEAKLSGKGDKGMIHMFFEYPGVGKYGNSKKPFSWVLTFELKSVKYLFVLSKKPESCIISEKPTAFDRRTNGYVSFFETLQAEVKVANEILLGDRMRFIHAEANAKEDFPNRKGEGSWNKAKYGGNAAAWALFQRRLSLKWVALADISLRNFAEIVTTSLNDKEVDLAEVFMNLNLFVGKNKIRSLNDVDPEALVAWLKQGFESDDDQFECWDEEGALFVKKENRYGPPFLSEDSWKSHFCKLFDKEIASLKISTPAKKGSASVSGSSRKSKETSQKRKLDSISDDQVSKSKKKKRQKVELSEDEYETLDSDDPVLTEMRERFGSPPKFELNTPTPGGLDSAPENSMTKLVETAQVSAAPVDEQREKIVKTLKLANELNDTEKAEKIQGVLDRHDENMKIKAAKEKDRAEKKARKQAEKEKEEKRKQVEKEMEEKRKQAEIQLLESIKDIEASDNNARMTEKWARQAARVTKYKEIYNDDDVDFSDLSSSDEDFVAGTSKSYEMAQLLILEQGGSSDNSKIPPPKESKEAEVGHKEPEVEKVQASENLEENPESENAVDPKPSDGQSAIQEPEIAKEDDALKLNKNLEELSTSPSPASDQESEADRVKKVEASKNLGGTPETMQADKISDDAAKEFKLVEDTKKTSSPSPPIAGPSTLQTPTANGSHLRQNETGYGGVKGLKRIGPKGWRNTER